jgi:two-component system phosphate regulon sensor histidine kinase PhoR
MSEYDKPPTLAERERAVRGGLSNISEFGTAVERIFGRIYRGIDRKQQSATGIFPAAHVETVNTDQQLMAERLREMQSMATRLQLVFQTINEGIILQDPSGRIEFMNDAAYRLLGSMKAFWESDLSRIHLKAQGYAPRTSEVEPIGAPVKVQVNHGIVGAQLAAISLPDGQPLGTLLLLSDVTKEALADRLKDEFITQITHELRTPLTAIKGMSEVLLSQPDDRPPNRKFLEAIGRNAAVLDRMILELLDLSEITAGTFNIRLQSLLLHELLVDTVKGQAPRLLKAQLNVDLMVGVVDRCAIIGDDRRLRWAFGHLLDNSIHYTEPGGTITIKVGAIKGDRVLISFTDTGVGIAEKDFPHIFERFYRGEARTPSGKILDPRGLGQGLFIARAVAEAHSGYLIANSEPGQGSEFTMGLPFSPPPQA